MVSTGALDSQDTLVLGIWREGESQNQGREGSRPLWGQRAPLPPPPPPPLHPPTQHRLGEYPR